MTERILSPVRVVVTRARHQAEELAQQLREAGAEVILLPVIGIAPPADITALRTAAENADSYDWIIFSSSNAVDAFASELPQTPQTVRARIAVVGAATREAATAKGFTVNVMPEKYVAESLVEALSGYDIRGARILIPSAAVTRDVIASELSKRGAHVDVVEAYKNVLPRETMELAPSIFTEPYPDWVSFASPSAVDNLVQLVGAGVVAKSKIASIGPVTSACVRKHALRVDAEASPHTVEGLVQAICRAVGSCR